MSKKIIPQITFQVEIEGKIYGVNYPASELRKIWENKTKEQNAFILRIPYNGENREYTYDMSYIMKLVRAVELAVEVIPKNLQAYLIDITQILSEKVLVPEKGRKEEIEKIWSCLSKMKGSNAILVGGIDVGKTTIAHEIARQVATCECPKQFSKSRVIEINTSELLKIESEFWYNRMVAVITEFIEVNKENTILYIDNLLHMKFDEKLIYLLHTILKKDGIKLLASIKTEDFETYFLEDNNISKYLNQINIVEPEKEELFDMIEARVKLLQRKYRVKISKKMINFAIDTSKLLDTSSSEPGKVLNVLERAFSEAKRKDKKVVDKECVKSCYDICRKNYENTPKKEKLATSYHETGHYIVQVMNEHQKNIKISFVSILPMKWWAGLTAPYFDRKEYAVLSKEYFIDEIAVCLAGRVAEKRIIETTSTGASNDLENANAYAKAIVMKGGFSNKDNNRNRSYDYEDYFIMPENKKELIDQEIQELINAGMQRAEEIISANEELLKIIAERLMVDEILTGEELEQICKEYNESKQNNK